MATAVPSSGASTSSKNVSDEERRWVVIGICLNKVLTPALRKVLSSEMPLWYQTLVRPPIEIDKSGKYEKTLPPSTLTLNYDSINNNAMHKSPKLYDYAVRDPVSLAKLFMRPFMASFTGFDHTMDASAALSVMCEAKPFFASGAAALAKKVRLEVRNEWAHCDFSHWTQPNFQTAMNDMESLVKNVGLASPDEKAVLSDIDSWRNNGMKLSFDCEFLDLIQTEVKNLREIVMSFNEDSKHKERQLDCLQTFQNSLSKEVRELRDRQILIEENLGRLRCQYTVQDVEKIKNKDAKIAITNDEVPYVFYAPKKNPWFAGRLFEINALENLLRSDDEIASKPKVSIAAVCGLGGVGKTSLVTEYAHQKRDFYAGGVYWFSGEDDTKFENSVNEVAMHFGTFQSDLFAHNFSATLAAISREKNRWLIVLDNMDQLDLSANIVKLLSGPWQHDASGHLLITTRRKSSALANGIRDFDERCCLSLKCFEIEEGKKFLFYRIGITHDEEGKIAEKLVQQLGGLPLALEQAGAYIRSLRCSLSQYLEHCDLQRLRLLNRQKASPVSVYESPERLAVLTTWHLNFDYIKETVDDGKAASTFLNACAFLNPNEIQKDIINIGEPPVENEEFIKFVETTLAREQIVKLLTDFSLFKITSSSTISVHHLVQKVIQDNLNPEEEVHAIIDAIRMLRYAFKNCSSPDDLLSFSYEKQNRSSIVCSDQSRFYNWHKLCLHSYELVEHLKRVVKKLDGGHPEIFQLETARIVYECALHLSANSKHDEAKEVANFARHIFHLSNHAAETSSSVFPHVIPLPELFRRYIQYSCNTPATSRQDGCRDSAEVTLHSVTSEEVISGMRTNGNDLFKKGLYNDALKMYSDAIDLSKGTAFFDVTLLSNRASVFLKLGQYDKALEDAAQYISQRPKCWKGYAKKALALVELKDMEDACVAASLAYYYDRNVFRKFDPFKRKFDSSQESRHFVCCNSSDLSQALLIANREFKVGKLPIIILDPGNYLVSLTTIDRHFVVYLEGVGLLPIVGCTFVGSEGECSVTFDDNLDVLFYKFFMAYNVTFHFGCTDCLFEPGSVVRLTHCSFTSSNNTYTSFCSKGELRVDFCKFYKCAKGGLLVMGDAQVENCEFYGNGAAGLGVRDGGRLVVRKSKMYANAQGLFVGPEVKECVMEDCDLYDNEWGGIVYGSTSGVTIRRNRIYDNDESGIAVINNSNVRIFENEISKNSYWGILINTFSQAVVKKNKIHNNQCGGICVDALSSPEQSVIEYNEISYNSGPGIHEENCFLGMTSCKCTENNLHDNKEKRNQSTAQSHALLCYHCKKPERSLIRCTKCFTAQYCGKTCQRRDWTNHEKVCEHFLYDGSILLNYVRKPLMELHLPINEQNLFMFAHGRRGPGLLPVGPAYCPRPNTTDRYIVKVSAGVEEGKEVDRSVVRLYDRSLTIDGILTGADQVYHLVRQHGAMGQLYSGWKKLFLWVQGPEDGKLRIFTNEFPPYQHW